MGFDKWEGEFVIETGFFDLKRSGGVAPLD